MEAALVELAKSELPLSNAKNMKMRAIRKIDKGDKTLLIIQAGNESPYAYFPVTYEWKDNFSRLSQSMLAQSL